MLPSLGVVDHAVAIGIPNIPIVSSRRWADLVASVCTRTVHSYHIACFYVGDSLRCGNLGLTLAHDDDAVAIGPDFNPVHAILMGRMQSNVGRINLRLRLALAEHGIIGHSLGDLNLNIFLCEV
jgi:hypothetical protein